MTELEYVLSRFDAAFRGWRGRRIVLHGTRDYARAILGQFGADYRFAGVMSLEPVPGGEFCALPFLGAAPGETAEPDPELIILTERVKYAEAAFQALRGECARRGIAVWNMYGLDEFRLHRMAQDYEVEGQREPDALYRMTEGGGIVAFEVVDTLFTRRDGRLIPGSSLFHLARRLLADGRRVAFSLRKSWSETEQIEAVASLCGYRPPVFPEDPAPAFFSGAAGAGALLIRREGEDLSFRRLREAAGDGTGILYFGAGLVNEFLLPRAYGIESIRFLEQYDCLPPAPHTEEEAEADWAERARAAIRAHEIVSFDIFDTLLLRRTLRPEDVFLLLQGRLRDRGLPAERFAGRRIAAQRELPRGALDEIYGLLARQMGWTPAQRDAAEAEELALERSLLCARAQTRALWEYAQAEGKTLVLTSDMYLPSGILGGFLREQGITGWDALLVSCECGAEKADGLLAQLRGCFGADCRIVHLDDRRDLDAACARALIDFFAVPPVCGETWNAAREQARNLAGRCLIGSTAAALQQAGDGALERYAAGVVGPLLTGYVAWLCERLREERFDRLLFLARDGWMPRQLYEHLRGEHPEWALPPSIYFRTSRRAAHPLRAADPTLLEDVARQGEQAGLDGPALLKRVYGLTEAELCPPVPGETSAAYLLRHRALLEKRARRARRDLLRYAAGLGLRDGMRCAVSDFFASGSTQADLQAALPLTLKGFNAANYKPRPEPGCEIEYYLHGGCDRILRGYIALESVFTAPEPTVESLGADGVPRPGPERRTPEELERLETVQRLALAFAKDWFSHFGGLEQTPSGALCMEIFAAADTGTALAAAYNDLIGAEIRRKNGENNGTDQSQS